MNVTSRSCLPVDTSRAGLRTPYGTVMNPTKLRMFVGAAVSYGKPVHFEAAVRQDSGGSSNAAYELLGSASRNALMAGARGLGVTGWLGKLQPDAQLAAALQPPPVECRGSGELVGVFIHIDSCMAWHGLQVSAWERAGVWAGWWAACEVLSALAVLGRLPLWLRRFGLACQQCVGPCVLLLAVAVGAQGPPA